MAISKFKKTRAKVAAAKSNLLGALDAGFQQYGQKVFDDLDEVEGDINARRIVYTSKLDEALRLEKLAQETDGLLSASAQKAVKQYTKAARIYMFGGPRLTGTQIAKIAGRQAAALARMTNIVLKKYDEDIFEYLSPSALDMVQSLTRRMQNQKSLLSQKLLFNSLTTFVNLVLSNEDPKAIGTPGQWTNTLRLLSVVAVTPSFQSQLNKRDARNAFALQHAITQKISPTAAVLTLQETLAARRALDAEQTEELDKSPVQEIVRQPQQIVHQPVEDILIVKEASAAKPTVIAPEKTGVILGGEEPALDEGVVEPADVIVHAPIETEVLSDKPEAVVSKAPPTPSKTPVVAAVKKAAKGTTGRKKQLSIQAPRGNVDEQKEEKGVDDDEVVVRPVKVAGPALDLVKEELLQRQASLTQRCEKAYNTAMIYLYGAGTFAQNLLPELLAKLELPEDTQLKGNAQLLDYITKEFSFIEQRVKENPTELQRTAMEQLGRLRKAQGPLYEAAAAMLDAIAPKP